MTIREKLELEMNKEEVKRWEGENADIEKSDKDTVPDNCDGSYTAGSD